MPTPTPSPLEHPEVMGAAVRALWYVLGVALFGLQSAALYFLRHLVTEVGRLGRILQGDGTDEPGVLTRLAVIEHDHCRNHPPGEHRRSEDPEPRRHVRAGDNGRA